MSKVADLAAWVVLFVGLATLYVISFLAFAFRARLCK